MCEVDGEEEIYEDDSAREAMIPKGRGQGGKRKPCHGDLDGI